MTYADDEAKKVCMEVRITYSERETNDRRNLVFPFYIIPEERVRADAPACAQPG